MHQHNDLHHFTQVQAAYQKALGETHERFSGIERAGESLTPIIDLWGHPEWDYLRGVRRLGRALTVAAVAAERSALLVRPTAGQIVVVEYVKCAASYAIRVAAPTIANSVPAYSGLRLDGRLMLAGSGLILHTASGVSSQFGTAIFFGSPAEASTLKLVAVNGSDLQIVGQADNTDLTVSIIYRERAALPGELMW